MLKIFNPTKSEKEEEKHRQLEILNPMNNHIKGKWSKVY